MCIYNGLFVHFRNEIWMCLKIIGKFAERNDRTSKFLAFLMSSFHTEDHHVCQTTMWFIDDHASHHVTGSTFWIQGPRFCLPRLKVNSQKTVWLKRTYCLLDKHPAFMRKWLLYTPFVILWQYDWMEEILHHLGCSRQIMGINYQPQLVQDLFHQGRLTVAAWEILWATSRV